ncbi:MAG: histidine kinase N-terminal 7TM domain-containing protein [Desulfosporosinus sp.]|nr:histidine kinase N-terminal 7TM domain-containing protein [Desulfosporosinus sp.]
MTYIYTPNIWPFIGSLIINLLMVIYILKNRRRNGGTAFIITLLFSSLWCVGTAMEISTVGLTSKLFWAKIGFPAYTFEPLAFLIMVLQITDLQNWTSKKKTFFYCIIPIITVILVWTNEFHGLIWQHVSINIDGTLARTWGVWFWVHAAYSDGLNIFSVFLIIRFWRIKAPLYDKQFRYLAFSMIFIIIIMFIMFINAVYTLGIGPSFDPTPIVCGISSLFITWALFRNNLFDLVLIARNRVMESMTDCIVVLDLKNRIVDLNPSTRYVFHCEAALNIGCNAADFFAKWPTLRKIVLENGDYVEFEYMLNKKYRYYETSLLPIKNERGNLLGKLLIIRDVTEKKITEDLLLQQQQEIVVKVERERMARDLHDNLGQILGFINVQSQAIREYLKHNQLQTAIQCLQRLTEVAQEAHQTVRETIITMRGDMTIIEKKMSDFFRELDRQLSLFEQNYGITTEIDYTGARSDCMELNNSRATVQVLNIIKESMNNIIKHSHASAMKIIFEENCDGLNISIIDNGCGFDIENIVSNHVSNYGLLFMKERAAEIGGCLNLYSEIGKGTTVKIQLPKQPEKVVCCERHSNRRKEL